MKHFVESHETIIEYYYIPTHKYAVVGELIPHKKYISGIYFFKKTLIDGQEVYLKIELSNDFITDILHQIQELESQLIELPYDELTF